MARLRRSNPGPQRSSEELLARARSRGAQLRRWRRWMTAGGVLASAGAVAAALALALSAPGAQHVEVTGPPPSAASCPASGFSFSPLSSPQSGLQTGPGLTQDAFAHLQPGQSVVLYQGQNQSITLTRGVANEAFSVSSYAHGSYRLNEVQVLGAATYYYPPGAGLPEGRIPFRYPPGPASVSDACDRYQLVGTGVAEPALMATAQRLQPHISAPTSPTTSIEAPTTNIAGSTVPPSTSPSTTPPSTATAPTTTAIRIASPPAAADLANNATGSCPTQQPLPAEANAATAAAETARAAVAMIYTDINTAGYTIDNVSPASAGGYGQIAYGQCGSAVGTDTWVVQLTFPAEQPSASLSHGQLFISRFSYGWQVWYRYH